MYLCSLQISGSVQFIALLLEALCRFKSMGFVLLLLLSIAKAVSPEGHHRVHQ